MGNKKKHKDNKRSKTNKASSVMNQRFLAGFLNRYVTIIRKDYDAEVATEILGAYRGMVRVDGEKMVVFDMLDKDLRLTRCIFPAYELREIRIKGNKLTDEQAKAWPYRAYFE